MSWPDMLVVLVLASLVPGHLADDNSSDGVLDFGDDWLPGMSVGDGGIGGGSDVDDFDDENNSTLCSHLSSDDFSNGCQFWMQGIILCCVGFGGILGNSVSPTYSL